MEDQTSKLVSEILTEVAKVLRSGNEDRLIELHRRVSGKGTPKRVTKPQQSNLNLPLEDIEKFGDFSSREALEHHLVSTYPGKAELASVAKALKVAVVKADNYESLVRKIVDATVGYRLRAEAIRGRTERKHQIEE